MMGESLLGVVHSSEAIVQLLNPSSGVSEKSSRATATPLVHSQLSARMGECHWGPKQPARLRFPLLSVYYKQKSIAGCVSVTFCDVKDNMGLQKLRR